MLDLGTFFKCDFIFFWAFWSFLKLSCPLPSSLPAHGLHEDQKPQLVPWVWLPLLTFQLKYREKSSNVDSAKISDTFCELWGLGQQWWFWPTSQEKNGKTVVFAETTYELMLFTENGPLLLQFHLSWKCHIESYSLMLFNKFKKIHSYYRNKCTCRVTNLIDYLPVTC